MIIAIDCDEVLINGTEYIIGTYNQRHGTSLPLKDAYNSKSPHWGRSSLEEVMARIENIQRSDEYAQIAPSPKAVEVVQKLAEHNELHMVTARSEQVFDITERMVEKYFGNSFVSLEHVGLGRSKGEVCRSIGADMLIDDSRKHVIDALEKGVRYPIWFGSYVWQQADEQLPLAQGIYRCANWDEVYSIVNDVSK